MSMEDVTNQCLKLVVLLLGYDVEICIHGDRSFAFGYEISCGTCQLAATIDC